MNIKKRQWITVLALSLTFVLVVACGAKGTPAPTKAPVATEVPPEGAAEGLPGVPQPMTPPAGLPQPPAGKGTYDTVFPLPDDVQNFMGEGGESQVNFQTSLSLEEVIEFYRQTLTARGLTERTILTAITDTTFSMVFDGWPNGKALVIQGVDLGPNRNVNIRFEDV